jgi:hypothetical protein
MNVNDKENLKFLLSLGEASLKAWYDQASDDDIAYAGELLAYHENQLDQQEAKLYLNSDKFIHNAVQTLQ